MIKSNLSITFFVVVVFLAHALGGVSKNRCQVQDHKDLVLCFLLRVL